MNTLETTPEAATFVSCQSWGTESKALKSQLQLHLYLLKKNNRESDRWSPRVF